MQGLPGVLHVKPKALSFDWVNGGEQNITVQNKSKKRMAVKLKVTGDDNLYTAIPVFQFVEAHASCVIKIMRLKGNGNAGTASQTLIVLETTVDSGTVDPQEAFFPCSIYPFNAVQLKLINTADAGSAGSTVAPVGYAGSSSHGQGPSMEPALAESESGYGYGKTSTMAPASASGYRGATTTISGYGATSGYGQGSMSGPAASGATSSYGQGSKYGSARGKVTQPSPVSSGGTSAYGQGSAFVPQTSSYGQRSTAPSPPATTGSASAYGNQKTSAYGKGSTMSPRSASAYGQGRAAAPHQLSAYGKVSTFVAEPEPAQSGLNSLYGKGNVAVYKGGRKLQSPTPPAGQQSQLPRPPSPSGSNSLYGKGKVAPLPKAQ